MANAIRTPIEALQRSEQTFETSRTQIEAQRRSVETTVTSTLAGNWHGEAATAYQNAMNPWYQLSITITNALERMRVLMTDTRQKQDQLEIDQTSTATQVGNNPAMQL